MSVLIALVCLLGGAAGGALLFKHFKSDEARVQDLEQRLQQLTEEHESYKREVHGHFSDSAHLLTKLTASYRDVYQHMAHGAKNLCPDYIANQVTQISASTSVLGSDDASKIGMASNDTRLSPPLDYVIAVNEGSTPAQGSGTTASNNT
jgi:uncharacterized protein